MRRLDKAESRLRWRELIDLWNEFDPIGVMEEPDGPRDEYESYCGPCLRLLEQNASIDALTTQVRAALDNMGLELNDFEILGFVDRMQKWYQANWADTHT